MPSPSPNTCTSTCRALVTSRSRNTAGLPNAAALCCIARSTVAGSSAGSVHASIPMPPPPATLLTRRGKPTARRGGHRGVDVDERRGPRREGHAGGRGRGARFVLGAEATDLLGRGPDEHQPRGFERGRGVGVLGEEAVAGVHAVDVVQLRHREQGVDVAVPGTGGGTDRHRERREVAVQRRAVDVGEHRHRLDAHAVERADDPARDLAAVGDQTSPHGWGLSTAGTVSG